MQFAQTTCIACGYELAGLMESKGRVTCPECGRRYHQGQLEILHQQRVYWGTAGWALGATPLFLVCGAVLTPLLPASFGPVLRIGIGTLVFFWVWSWVYVFVMSNSRARLSGFSHVAGACIGFIVAMPVASCLALALR
jgi:hypothetical protein